MSDINAIAAVKRDRSARGCYVANPNPEFSPPSHHKKRPQFVRKAMSYANRDVAAFGGMQVLLHARGRRHINEHRRKALTAVVQGMLHYVNLITWQVEAPVIELARQCGLSTVSARGIESISRCARAVVMAKEFGLLDTDLVWDRKENTWIPKIIHVTDLFWDAIGIGAEAANRERVVRFERMKALNLGREEAGRMTLSEFKELRKMRSVQHSFEIRRNKIASKQQMKTARRIAAMPLDQQRQECGRRLIAAMERESPRALFELQRKPGEFDRLVTRQMRRLQAMATDPLPGESLH